jgi:hypothetical protein
MSSQTWGQPGRIDANSASEWEATGFNNGRRMVRDSNGYLHAFWHSKPAPPWNPLGAGCDIYYSHTVTPTSEPVSMALQGAWLPPTNMTAGLGNYDNRYASAAIEYEVFGAGNVRLVNQIHVVWQALNTTGPLARYEVMYAQVPVTNPPAVPLAWAAQTNLSNTPTDSLVPAICINQYSPNVGNQHLHVVWQEEDVFGPNQPPPVGGPLEDMNFSDIAYRRSVNSGAAWAAPAGGYDPDGPGGPIPPYLWDNLSQTLLNSQMPTVACIIDRHTGSPPVAGTGDLGYNSTSVHLAYHEDTGAPGINVFYTQSLNDGGVWNPRINVSALVGTSPLGADAYPNIAADMLDQAHLTFMHNNMVGREPLRTGVAATQYQPGVSPTVWWAFPGPDVGMYGLALNSIIYAWNGPGGGFGLGANQKFWTLPLDLEFPTVSLDRWQHVNVNWQHFTGVNYEITRDSWHNIVPPQFPLVVQQYAAWLGPFNDSNDPARDDLFPNLAFKKVAMYYKGLPPEAIPAPPVGAGYDEVWTKTPGLGEMDAVAPAMPREVWQDGSMVWDGQMVPVRLSKFMIE